MSAYEKRLLICDFIDEYWIRNWTSPTVREIGEYIGLSSPASVLQHLRILVEEGTLERKELSPQRVLYRLRDNDRFVVRFPPGG